MERCSQARVADKPVTQVIAAPLPAVCGDPRGSRLRRADSSCDWTAGRASHACMDHLVVSHRRCPEWSDVWGAEHRQQCGRRRAKTRGIDRFSRTDRWVWAMRDGEAEFNRETVSNSGRRKGTRTGSEAAPGRISGADKNTQPH